VGIRVGKGLTLDDGCQQLSFGDSPQVSPGTLCFSVPSVCSGFQHSSSDHLFVVHVPSIMHHADPSAAQFSFDICAPYFRNLESCLKYSASLYPTMLPHNATMLCWIHIGCMVYIGRTKCNFQQADPWLAPGGVCHSQGCPAAGPC